MRAPVKGRDEIAVITRGKHEATPGEWRVRPIWPLSLAYLILELGPDYDYTVIGHPSKRWVWVLSRKPSL
jgi:apolipoprotein D and lipocalin family protein